MNMLNILCCFVSRCDKNNIFFITKNSKLNRVSVTQSY